MFNLNQTPSPTTQFSNNILSLEGAGNAVKDKVDQKGYEASAESNKQAAMH